MRASNIGRIESDKRNLCLWKLDLKICGKILDQIWYKCKFSNLNEKKNSVINNVYIYISIYY
jgi:hypothetical protein